MIRQELTKYGWLATTGPMQGTTPEIAIARGGLTRRRVFRKKAWALGVLAGGVMTLGGCVSVNAPDKPIVIELNINIKQEVIYRLAADAGNTIEQNKDIF